MDKLNNKEYWKIRAEQRIVSAEKKVLRFENQMQEQFEKVYKNIENKIASLYFKYGSDNSLEYADVVKYLTDNERKEFQKDLEFYIEKAKDKDFKAEYKQYLQALSTRARVQRLETLKASIKYEAHELYEDYILYNTQITFDDILNDTYYKAIFDIQQFQGIGVSFAKISSNTLKSLVEYPWSGSNYSDKIWGNVENFSKKLENTLTSGIIQGKSNQEMAKELRRATDTAYKNAIRLVRTETNYIANEATNKAYDEYEVEEYQYLATLDLRTSEVCRNLDGRIFKKSDRIIGVNYPPLHPNCRSTTIPYFSDLEEFGGNRIARDADGRTYKVAGNMSYKDWYKKYVSINSKEIIAEKKIKNKAADKKQFEKYINILGKDGPKNFDSFQELKYEDTEKWTELKKLYNSKNREIKKQK